MPCGRSTAYGRPVTSPAPVTCVGGAVLDRSYRLAAPVVLGTSNPATGGTSYGGVARNVAENLVRLDVQAALVSVVGDDVPGRALLDDLDRLNINRWATRPLAGRTTATYGSVLGPDGELVLGVADMAVLDEITPEVVAEPLSRVDRGAWVFADANLPPATHARIAAARRTQGFLLAVDTVSVAKAPRLPADLGAIDVLFTNRDEAAALLRDRGRGVTVPAPDAGSDPTADLEHELALATVQALLATGVQAVVLTLGAGGQLVGRRGAEAVRLPAAPAQVRDVSGAGDALVGGTLADLVLGTSVVDAVRTGAAAAALATESTTSVHPRLSRAAVAERRSAVPQPPLAVPGGTR